MIVSEVAGSSTGQLRIGVVDELHHLLHLVPLREAQSDTLARWLDFDLAVGYVELSKIDALEAHSDRHVTSTANMLAIVDGWIVFVGVLVYRDDLSIDLVKAEAKLSLSATSANEIISELVLKCVLRNDVGNKYDGKIMVIFSPVRCKLDEFVHGVFLFDGHRWLTFLLLHSHRSVVAQLIRFHVARSMVVRRLNADGREKTDLYETWLARV